jgi:putative ABC transport system permease protein
MERLTGDIALAFRRLRATPGFTTVAVLILALGVGVNSAVFNVVDPLLLRKLPVGNPEELVILSSAGTLHAHDIWERAAVARFSAARDVLRGVIADVGLFEFDTTHRGQPPSPASIQIVSPNYFDVLGLRPHLGRLLTDADDSEGRAVVVLGHSFWSRTFGEDPGVVGEPLVVGGRAHTIVGIAPRGFSGLRPGAIPDVYVSLGSGLRSTDWVRIVGRLRHDVSLDRARTGLEPTFRDVVAASAIPPIELEQGMSRLLVTSIARGSPETAARFGAASATLAAVVSLVLLVAIANLATLMLTRAAARGREITIRRSLGATAGDIGRLIIVESAVVAAIGTTAGVVLANWTTDFLVTHLIRGGIAIEPGGGLRRLLFSAALMGLAVLGCGALPAVVSSRAGTAGGLRLSAYGHQTARIGAVRRILVVTQIAGSVVLLTGTGLLAHSLMNLYSADVGFDPERVLAVSMADTERERSPQHADRIVRDLAARIEQLPGVDAVAFAGLRPFARSEIGINLIDDGATMAPVHTFMNGITPRYFETLGIPLVNGRDCAMGPSAASAQEVVINERLARQLLGRTHRLPRPLRSIEGERRYIAVGVARDAIYNSVRETPRNFLYVCRQTTAISGTMFVRSASGRADSLLPSVTRTLRAAAPDVRAVDAQTLGAFLRSAFGVDRLITGLLSAFTALALAIAVVGLYGVLAGMVETRLQEIGLRIALGASPRNIAGVVGSPAARLVGTGLVLGGIGGLAFAPALSSLLFETNRYDPLTHAGTALAMLIAAATACYVPVRRALRVDPVNTLRAE